MNGNTGLTKPMSDAEWQALQQRNAERVERMKKELGSLYILAPANLVSRLHRPSQVCSLLTGSIA